MRKIEVNLYKFKELPEKIQEKVLNKNRYIETENNWDDYILEEETENLKKYGFLDCKIHYTGFCSQGDGACFDCSDFDIDLLINNSDLSQKEKNQLKKIKDYLNINIYKKSHLHHYYHKKTRYIEIEFCNNSDKEYSKIKKLIEKFEKDIEQTRLNLCYEIYKKLENEYENIISDEYIADLLVNEECEFTENGEIYKK